MTHRPIPEVAGSREFSPPASPYLEKEKPSTKTHGSKSTSRSSRSCRDTKQDETDKHTRRNLARSNLPFFFSTVFSVSLFRDPRPRPGGANTRAGAIEPSDGYCAGITNDGGGEHSQPVRVSDVPVRVKTADLEETLPSLEAAAKATHLWDAFKVVGFG